MSFAILPFPAEAEAFLGEVMSELWLSIGQYTVMTMLLLCVVDFTIASHFKSRWFLLHSLANAAISFLVFPDVVRTIRDPFKTICLDKEYSYTAFSIVVAIHLYHCLPFNPSGAFRLHPVDYLHHILMIFIGCPLQLFADIGPLANFNLFFVCGLPGGIDYVMLVFVKQGYVPHS